MHTLAQLCVRRPVFATMLILSLVVVGIFSYFTLGVDLFPKVDIPTVVGDQSPIPALRPRRSKPKSPRRWRTRSTPSARWTRCAPPRPKASRWSSFSFELSKNGDVAAQEVQNKVNLIVAESAADRQAAGGAEVRSRRHAHPADRRLRAALAARRDADRRQADQAEAGKRQGRRPDHHRGRRASARSTCWWIPTSCAPTT